VIIIPENKSAENKDVSHHKNPLLTADVVISCSDNKIVMVKRKNPPYQGQWALPGGFVEYGESVENAAVREAQEETGLHVELDRLVGVYSQMGRDPRGHVVTVCFLANMVSGELKADSDAEDVFKFTKKELNEMELAFDHEMILKDAFKFLNNIK
jgi:8-oxo-dGTP diphosphatase